MARVEESHDFPLAVEQKFGEIPRDLLRLSFGFIEESASVPQVPIDRMSMRAVDFYLFEECKVGLVPAFNVVQDLLMSATFLLEKLVAGKGQDLESLLG